MASGDVPANDACTVRLATPADHDLLQVVLDGSAGVLDADVFGMKAAQLLYAHQVHIGFLEGAPIGCVMATVAPTTGIHGLNVVPTHRSKGHASTLVRAVIEHNDGLQEQQSYWTAVDPNAPGAIERFGKLGFEVVAGSDYKHLKLMIRPNASLARNGSPSIERGSSRAVDWDSDLSQGARSSSG